jgi:hypothetical protein
LVGKTATNPAGVAKRRPRPLIRVESQHGTVNSHDEFRPPGTRKASRRDKIERESKRNFHYNCQNRHRGNRRGTVNPMNGIQLNQIDQCAVLIDTWL